MAVIVKSIRGHFKHSGLFCIVYAQAQSLYLYGYHELLFFPTNETVQRQKPYHFECLGGQNLIGEVAKTPHR